MSALDNLLDFMMQLPVQITLTPDEWVRLLTDVAEYRGMTDDAVTVQALDKTLTAGEWLNYVTEVSKTREKKPDITVTMCLAVVCWVVGFLSAQDKYPDLIEKFTDQVNQQHDVGAFVLTATAEINPN